MCHPVGPSAVTLQQQSSPDISSQVSNFYQVPSPVSDTQDDKHDTTLTNDSLGSSPPSLTATSSYYDETNDNNNNDDDVSLDPLTVIQQLQQEVTLHYFQCYEYE